LVAGTDKSSGCALQGVGLGNELKESGKERRT
jgi:hypothetical protein